jgi:hypothetical protein
MKSSASLVLFTLLALSGLKAQETIEEKKGYKYDHNFDLGLSSNGSHHAGALSWVKFHSIIKKRTFKIGYGARLNSQFGSDLNYITAPANLTGKLENIDTFFVSSPQNNSFNLSINLQYTIKNIFDIGFNIDAVGASFGSSVNGKYISNQSDMNNTKQTASPTKINLLLVGDNDIGMLNSEFYLRYWLTNKIAIRGGASFMFTEYTTTSKLRLNNNRWRHKAMQGLIGITFCPLR